MAKVNINLTIHKKSNTTLLLRGLFTLLFYYFFQLIDINNQAIKVLLQFYQKVNQTHAIGYFHTLSDTITSCLYTSYCQICHLSNIFSGKIQAQKGTEPVNRLPSSSDSVHVTYGKNADESSQNSVGKLPTNPLLLYFH